jgi:hypothetical protein
MLSLPQDILAYLQILIKLKLLPDDTGSQIVEISFPDLLGSVFFIMR